MSSKTTKSLTGIETSRQQWREYEQGTGSKTTKSLTGIETLGHSLSASATVGFQNHQIPHRD